MIRFKATIEFRDDKFKTYDLEESPTQHGDYWCLEKDRDNYQYIPKEAIKSLQVKCYWKK